MTRPDTTFRPNVLLVEDRENGQPPFVSFGADNYREKDGHHSVAIFADLDRAAEYAAAILEKVAEARGQEPADLDAADLDALAQAS
jgi:hypothetical protein